MEDIRFYQKEGINGLGAFTGFDCLCWPSSFNMWCWLKLWNNPETTVEALKDDFYPKYFGKAGQAVREYMDQLENAMQERTSSENITKIKDLSKMLDSIPPPHGDQQLADRLKLVKIHHEYCVLLKEIFQAFIDNAPERQQAFEKPYMMFFEEHRKDLEGQMAQFPPLWGNDWWGYVKKSFSAFKMPKDPITFNPEFEITKGRH